MSGSQSTDKHSTYWPGTITELVVSQSVPPHLHSTELVVSQYSASTELVVSQYSASTELVLS